MPLRAIQIPRHLALAIFFSAIIWVAGGCNAPQSVNSFYRSQDVVFDSSLLGEWRGADPSEEGSVLVKAKTADSYLVEITAYDEDREAEVSWTLEAHQFNYGQDAYIDVFPVAFRVNGKKENFETKADGMYFVVPVHTVMRMHHDGQKLSLLWSEEDEPLNIFKKEDETSKAKRLARERRQQDILTMSTERLQQEVLGSPPRGTRVSETKISLVRTK
jgi:hypothetical protein